MFRKYINQHGQTLIEALVALGASVLVISAITIAVVSALNNVQYAKNQNLATQYAQEGMETVRQISQSDWTLFSSYNSGSYCLNQRAKTLTSSTGTCGQNVGIYSRGVNIVKDNPSITNCQNNVFVTVNVSWSDGKCEASNPMCHNVILKSCFPNNINSLTAP